MVILFLTGHFVRPKDHLLLRVPPLGRVDTATPDRRVQLLAGALQQAGRLLLQPPGLLRGLQVQQGEGPRALQVHQDGGRKRGVGSGNKVLRGRRVRGSAAIQTKRSFVRLSTGLVIIYLLIEPYYSEQLNVWFSSLKLRGYHSAFLRRPVYALSDQTTPVQFIWLRGENYREAKEA